MYNYIKENRVKLLLLPLILYWIILFIGTTIPSNSFSDVLNVGDKLKHFFAYFILAFLLSLNLHFQKKWEKIAVSAFFYAFLITVVYGLLDELHQIPISGRYFDWLDLAANFIGILIGAAILKWFLSGKVSDEKQV